MKVRITKRVVEVDEKLGKALISQGVAREIAPKPKVKVSGILMREYAVSEQAASAETATTEPKTKVKIDPPADVDAADEEPEAESKPNRRKRASEVSK